MGCTQSIETIENSSTNVSNKGGSKAVNKHTETKTPAPSQPPSIEASRQQQNSSQQQQQLPPKSKTSDAAATTTTTAAQDVPKTKIASSTPSAANIIISSTTTNKSPSKKTVTISSTSKSPSPVIPGGKKLTVLTGWKGGGSNKVPHGGNNKNNSAGKPPPPPPLLVARPRTDTWAEVSVRRSPANSFDQHPDDNNSILRTTSNNESKEELMVHESDDNNNNANSFLPPMYQQHHHHHHHPSQPPPPTAHSAMPQAPAAAIVSSSSSTTNPPQAIPISSSTLVTTTTSSSSSSPSVVQVLLTPQQQQVKIQEQWKMIWETQSSNLVDPADVPAVIDTLMDKIVNRLSPAQVTFIQRKVRLVVNRLHDTQYTSNNTVGTINNTSSTGGTSNTNTNNSSSSHRQSSASSSLKKAVFGVSSSSSSLHAPTGTGNSTHPSSSHGISHDKIAEAKLIVEKYHLLTETIVRQVLPNFHATTSTSTAQSSSASGLYLSGTTTNAITLMLAFSATSTESHVRDRTSFSARASAENAALEMDVNKKQTRRQQGQEKKMFQMPKPSQVPILEGRAEFPPGITLQALCTVLSIALQSPHRDQKLQLLFYLCLLPEVLTEFVTTHPAGGVPCWLLEVGHDIVLSLASLTHYHYYGHAFLPTQVPTESENGKDCTIPVGAKDNGENATTTTKMPVKREFMASKSRMPISVPMARLRGIVEYILETEQNNNAEINLAQEKQTTLMMQQRQQQQQHQSSAGDGTSYPEKGAPSSSPSSFLRRTRNGGGSMEPAASTDVARNVNSSMHNKKTRRKSSHAMQQTSAEVDGGGGNDNSAGSGVQPQTQRHETYSLFALTDVMEKILDSSNATFDDCDNIYCYPTLNDDGTILTSLDRSRGKLVSGTEEFLRNKISYFNNAVPRDQTASTSTVVLSALTLEDFRTWADCALDDLALDVILHRLLGNGILPTPAMEHDIILKKWLDWQTSIRRRTALLSTSTYSYKNGLASEVGQNGNNDDRPDDENDESDSKSLTTWQFSESVQKLFQIETNGGTSNARCNGFENGRDEGSKALSSVKNGNFVWGGLGNVDGGGAIGYGVLYCISKDWWDDWTAYTSWTFLDDVRQNGSSRGRKRKQKYSGDPYHASTHQQEQQQKTRQLFSFRERRPGALSTESLLEHEHDSIVRGSMGSYEVMKAGLVRGEDYVLVPPGVWDSLYELYGGGPPLPRMIRLPSDEQPQQQRQFTTGTSSSVNDGIIDSSDDEVEVVIDADDINDDRSFVVRESASNEVEIVHLDDEIIRRDQDSENVQSERYRFAMPRPMKIPPGLCVTLHPWIIHVHLCDPTQPYRRGEAGPMSIRLMAAPYQPLWRLFAEIICRFSFHPYKAFDLTDSRGKARLWKKTDPTTTKEPVTRYGPWNLLCKNRHAILPLMSSTGYGVEGYDVYSGELAKNWKEYADNATLETCGLLDQDQLMLEFAVQNKIGELTWPREAAAKAGRVRRLAEEDRKFRRLLQGLSEDGNVLFKPPTLVGLEVDAMDSTGRWYTVRILEVDIVDDDTEEEVEDDATGKSSAANNEQSMSRKKVKVFFKEHGGHTEWIDVESDRLATAGRFASQADQDCLTTSPTTDSNSNNNNANGTTGSETKTTKVTVTARKSNSSSESTDNTKLCTLPGVGACGLTNLGNTCYMNSAIQCISYLPILRAYLISGQYKATGDLNKENVLGSGGKLLEETADLMRSMWSSRFGEKSPSKFRMSLGKMNPQFAGADQQDAQEFLNYIIDALHEDCYKDKKKPYVEPLEDDWVNINNLARVGDEAWRRFLRRNRSIMSDVAMGQALNTVTCPVCKYASRNFDPFNLLSIPIPTVADVLFQCTVYRRATAKNCPWVLAKVRKGDVRTARYDFDVKNGENGPPSEHFVAEQYVIALSRLADSGDLRLQIQNLSGIRANQLRLCRAEEVVVNKEAKDGSVVKTHVKVFPLTDKDGPASQQAKKRGPNEENITPPTQIIAFEMTLNPRALDGNKGSENVDEEEEEEQTGEDFLPSPKMAALLEKHLEVYGDDLECRMVDTDSLLIAKAVSRSLWPRSEDELKLGLRVDAMDHRGNWFPGSVIEILDDKSSMVDGSVNGEERTTSTSSKRVRVHFDNFSPKWDELYSIEDLKKGRVRPLYSHAVPKRKPTEFLVYHRHTDRHTGQLVVFGQSFFVQCQNEWSNARAGGHILAQVCRFMQYKPNLGGSDDPDDPRNAELESKAYRLFEKTHAAMSDLIDLLVDCDREYVRLALGVSHHNNEEEKSHPFRNPTFDASLLSSALVKKVAGLLQRLPFEVRICTVEGAHSHKPSMNSEEVLFPFSLVRTIGNFMNIRHAVFLQWREPSVADRKHSGNDGASLVTYRSCLKSPVMYVEPTIHVHEASASLLNDDAGDTNKKRKNSLNGSAVGGSAGIDLSYCLTEFCKVQKLPISDNWTCPVCKVYREGGQNMNLWRLPDLLTFHIKRFNMSARWHEKITTKVNFPLTGLDMSPFCHKESPVLQEDTRDSYIYDLIGVMNHYGSMTGGHYVATCKATPCGRDGREEVAYTFNGIGASTSLSTEGDEADGSGTAAAASSGSAWRLGRPKQEVVNHGKVAATMLSKHVSESAEPLWLQFDDEVVEAIPPRCVVSEMAYVLFYRRRRISPSNVAKYSTLE